MHDSYWKGVWNAAHERLNHLMKDCAHDVADIVGDDDGIDSYADAKVVLAHALRYADNCEEKACAILSVGEALHALHELGEHSSEAAGAASE